MLAMVLLLALAGCGGSEDSSQAHRQDRLYPAITGPTREFLVNNGDNVVQVYGREATTAEREEASEVIGRWMRARAAKDWEEDCRYLSQTYKQLLAKDAHSVSKGKVDTCAEALDYFGHQASGDYVNTLTGPIDSFRVGRGQGFAQYHGRYGKDWVVSMEREGGRWWVANATPVNRET